VSDSLEPLIRVNGINNILMDISGFRVSLETPVMNQGIPKSSIFLKVFNFIDNRDNDFREILVISLQETLITDFPERVPDQVDFLRKP
jgi:hypothetical protein